MNRGDSVVSDKINKDLLIIMGNIQNDISECSRFLDHSRNKTRSVIFDSMRIAENFTLTILLARNIMLTTP